MTWTSFHHRGETLRRVIAAADARRDGVLPLDVDGVRETFPDELALLGALQLRWHTRLAGHIERELLSQPMDLERAVVTAWRATADELPGVLAIVDRYRAEPLDDAMAAAMAKSADKEHTLLAVMAGQAGATDSAAPHVGALVGQKARAGYRPVPRAREDAREERAPTGLLDRIKAALAA